MLHSLKLTEQQEHKLKIEKKLGIIFFKHTQTN